MYSNYYIHKEVLTLTSATIIAQVIQRQYIITLAHESVETFNQGILFLQHSIYSLIYRFKINLTLVFYSCNLH